VAITEISSDIRESPDDVPEISSVEGPAPSVNFPVSALVAKGNPLAEGKSRE
jgi:hypothetical protein